MGDRANFGVKQGNDTVYLYAHWGGYQMMNTLASALAAVKAYGRLSDEAYATRILFSNIIGDAWNQELGYGISVNHLVDNEHKVPVVDFREGTVTLWEFVWGERPWEPIFTTTIDNFITKYAKGEAEDVVDQSGL